jgi:hypothetical protein
MLIPFILLHDDITYLDFTQCCHDQPFPVSVAPAQATAPGQTPGQAINTAALYDTILNRFTPRSLSSLKAAILKNNYPQDHASSQFWPSIQQTVQQVHSTSGLSPPQSAHIVSYALPAAQNASSIPPRLVPSRDTSINDKVAKSMGTRPRRFALSFA